VSRQRLGVVVAGARERAGDATVACGQLRVGQRTRNDLANTVVVHLEFAPAVSRAGADQALALQRSLHRVAVVFDARRQHRHAKLHGLAEDCQHLEQALRLGGQFEHALAYRLGEPQGTLPSPQRRELTKKQRAPAGLARQRLDHGGTGVTKQGARQVPDGLQRKFAHRHIANERGTLACTHAPQRADERRCLGIFAAVRADEEQGRRIGTAEQCCQQWFTVGVGPLQVVDEQHHRTLVGHAMQELSERQKRPAALFGGIGGGFASFGK
jgi:hypothetical protein